MANYKFSVTLEPSQPQTRSTLRWTVEGGEQITLDGTPVPAAGSKSVQPTVNTTYTLAVSVPTLKTGQVTASFTVQEDALTLVPESNRPPTVRLTPENIAHLKTFPRPPRDNGRGLHFHLDLRDFSIAETVQRLQSIHATWTLIYAQDELQAQRAAKACWAAGIMPVVRIGKKIDEFVDTEQYVRALQAINVPPYVQIYNEPGDGREWEEERPNNYTKVFGERWARHAAKTVDVGGYAGLQVMGKEELFAAVDAVAAMGRQDIWQRAFFVVHNYGVNHPPAYPYDELTQREHPGRTILEDSVSILSFLAFAKWMQERIGFVLPIVGGEGGWQFGVNDDRRYPEVIQPYHADYHREVFDWFRTGLLSNGEPLPDYLFSVTPWLVGGWNTSEDWWGGPLGDKTETIEAVRTIPAFIRTFSWRESGTDDDGEPVDEEDNGEEPTDSPSLAWDSRLDGLGVRLTRMTAAQGWRLVSARYRDVHESDNKHHICIKAIDGNQTPVAGAKFLVDWIGRRTDEQPGLLTTDDMGMANYAMFINMHPEEKDGILFALAQNQPSDRIDGMGLPNNHHVCFDLTFQMSPA
ncbi:MAG TPA: hypothetical protein P5121_05065 [Caldilineaceae bacterium]|nr:hypothetical protein [Caldilineaceae bacterium]